MSSLLSFLFALRVGMVPVATAPASVPIRAESREIAAATLQLAPPSTSATATGPHLGEWALGQLAGPPVGPVFTSYRPDEWVQRFAEHLHVADLGVTRLAMWLVSIPVELDVRPGRAYMRVTLRTP